MHHDSLGHCDHRSCLCQERFISFFFPEQQTFQTGRLRNHYTIADTAHDSNVAKLLSSCHASSHILPWYIFPVSVSSQIVHGSLQIALTSQNITSGSVFYALFIFLIWLFFTLMWFFCAYSAPKLLTAYVLQSFSFSLSMALTLLLSYDILCDVVSWYVCGAGIEPLLALLSL